MREANLEKLYEKLSAHQKPLKGCYLRFRTTLTEFEPSEGKPLTRAVA